MSVNRLKTLPPKRKGQLIVKKTFSKTLFKYITDGSTLHIFKPIFEETTNERVLKYQLIIRMHFCSTEGLKISKSGKITTKKINNMDRANRS